MKMTKMRPDKVTCVCKVGLWEIYRYVIRGELYSIRVVCPKCFREKDFRVVSEQ